MTIADQPFSATRAAAIRRALTLLLLPLLLANLSAADWPCWRGTDGLGVSPEKGLPSQWSTNQNIAWTAPVPGKGASSPIIAGDRVYVTSQTADEGLHVLAIARARGEVLWDREIARGKLHANNIHNMASPTPVSDGSFVWALFGTGDLACLDRDGKIVWQRNLVKEYGPFKYGHGYGSSPMLDDGKLFLTVMHAGPSYLLALDPKTGQNIWKKDRNLDPTDESRDSYSSPLFLRDGGRTQLILEGAESVTSYAPADGELLWTSGGLKVAHSFGRTIAGLAAGDGVLVVVGSGYQHRGYTAGLKSDLKTDADRRLWTQPKFSPDCATPVVTAGHVFMITDDGNASCLDLKTGEPRWQERFTTVNVKVSPVAADGKVYFMNNQGNCTVVKASPKLEILSTNELNEPTLSTPSISGGKLFLRTQGHLYCVGK